MDTYEQRIDALKRKAADFQAAEDACQGLHLWIADYSSQIVGGTGSCYCERCGTRRSWEDAKKTPGSVFKYQVT